MRMKSLILALGALVLAAGRAPDPADLAIRNVTVIDGAGGTPVVGDVLVRDGRVVAVRGANEAALPARDSIDGTGRFVIPGLIDSHVHLSSFAPRPAALQALLAAGVTTVRDMGGDVPTLTLWRGEIARGQRAGPELLIVGATLNGELAAPFHRVVATPAEAEAAVAEMAAAGAVQVKVHNATTPGVLTAVIAAARARGLKVVGHIGAGPGPLRACQAGMAEISHASALLESVLWRTEAPPADLVAALEELNGPGSDALYACMAANRMAFAPNLSMYEPIIAGLEEPQAGMTRRLVGVLGQIALRAGKAGVPILAATDANGDDERLVFGASLHRELAMLVEAGFTPMQALQAATSTPARHLGREGDIGVLRPGAQADLVLLCADPLADIANTRAIVLVLADGKRAAGTGACPATSSG